MRKVYRIFALFAFLCGIINAFSLQELEGKPKGVARDFYLYLYLQDTATLSNEDALKIYHLIDNKTPKIMQFLIPKLPLDLLPKAEQCKAKSFVELQKSDDECFNAGFRLDYAYLLKPKDIKRLTSQKTQSRIKILQIKNKGKILEAILEESGEEFSAIFNAISSKSAIFNTAPKNLKKLSHKNYDKTLYNMIVSKKYPKFSTALLKENIVGVNDWSFYALGLNELDKGDLKKAAKYFENAANVASFKLMRDKSHFWVYKINEILKNKKKSDEFLLTLSQSTNFNLYSLFAVKKLQAQPKYHIVSEDSEIFKNIKPSTKAPLNLSNPFEWQRLRSEIVSIKDKESLIKIAKIFHHKDTIPHLTFILNRYFNFQKSFFVKPYKGDLIFDDENLVYAVARQESAFIPAVISRSYALGMMQIMPFNVDNFAKALKAENITMDSMFEPEISLQFGDYYLSHLKKEFKHPLFVSYAYNGGPTFIRNFLKNDAVFSAKNRLDPWISMEFIPYEESRFYAFSVMANYIVYRDIDGQSVNIEDFLNQALR